jgi:hypothetical protein
VPLEPVTETGTDTLCAVVAGLGVGEVIVTVGVNRLPVDEFQ